MRLSEELGYAITSDQIREQLLKIEKSTDHFALLAVSDELVLGYIHGFIALRLTSLPFLEIGTLVVHNEYRKQGIGSLLVKELETMTSGFNEIRVRCNVKRTEAHTFYLEKGFSEKKLQKVFKRSFGA